MKESPRSLRSFLEVKANKATPEIRKILDIPDGLLEKVTTNVPLGGLIYERNRTNR